MNSSGGRLLVKCSRSHRVSTLLQMRSISSGPGFGVKRMGIQTYMGMGVNNKWNNNNNNSNNWNNHLYQQQNGQQQKRQLHQSFLRLQQKDNNENKQDNKQDKKQDNKQDDKDENYKKMMEYLQSKEFKKTMLYSFVFTFLYSYFSAKMMQSSENQQQQSVLTFQDFKTKYLERGMVKKVFVINNQHINAELMPSGTTTLGHEDTSAAGNTQYDNNQDFHSEAHFPPHKENGGDVGQMVSFTIGSIDFFEDEMEKIQDNLKIPGSERIPIIYVQHTSLLQYLFPFVPTILLLGGIFYISKRFSQGGGIGGGPGGGGGGPGGMFQVGKSKAKLFNQETDIKVKFQDVAGCDEAKQEIMEFVEFLKKPEKFTKLGAKIPRGAILSGPPGTGKTLLAKATAGEAGVPFLSVSGSEFVEMFVGVGASRVRDLFAKARTMSPCIIFIDEIDAIGRSRSGGKNGGGMGGGGGANDERESTLNQLLVEMDGFETNEQIIVLAGTNRADILDKALMRPGRFDRHIGVDNPDVEGRKSIYKVHLKNLKIKPELLENLELLSGKLSALTPGFSGADIANACNESALIAARHNDEFVEMKHFEQAIERVIAGLEKKTKILSPKEKKIVAYHEAGHAVCGWYLENADPLLKVSIVPRGQGALGYAQYLPGDMNLMNNLQLMDRMTMALGGRVSEEMHFDSVTSGAHDDFKKVTAMATSMVKSLGMCKEIGYINYDESKNNSGGVLINKPFSEQTSRKLDEQIKKLVDRSHENCKQLLTKHKDDIEKIAQLLLKKEILTRKDMIDLLGPRKFEEKNPAFTKYLDQQ